MRCSSPQESLKRKRDDEDMAMEDILPNSSPLTEVSSLPDKLAPSFAALPPAVLLVSLPGLLLHPPNHPLHAHSLCVSLLSVRRCLRISGLSPEIECRALTAIAELGINVLEGGFGHDEDHVWAHGVESEVEEATSKGLLIAQKHPSLRPYRSQLTFLAAQLAVWQQNVKFARTLLRRLITTFLPSDPPHLVYTAHLKHITSLMISPSSASPSLSFSPSPCHPQDTRAALTAIQNMENLAIKSNHPQVELLTRVLRLRLLVSSGQLEQVEEALTSAEEGLGIEYVHGNHTGTPSRRGLRLADMNTPQQTVSSTPKSKSLQDCDSPSTNSTSGPASLNFKTFSDPFSLSMAIHTLIIGVIFYTYGGRAEDSTSRLSHLHSILDGGALRFTPEQSSLASGIIEIPFPNQRTPPMYVQTTHPKILYVLTFLVSAVAKKDPVGRKPKRKLFATEGLAAWEKEVKRELKMPTWGTAGDVERIETRMAKIKGDLLCELIGVSIMRSEFDEADKTLSILISHLRTHALFDSFAARITLHHAHLAHSRGDLKRAMQCYKVAAHIAEEEGSDFVNVSARAGLVALQIGLFRRKQMQGGTEASRDDTKMEVDCEDGGASDREEDDEWTWERIEKEAVEVADACKVSGGTLCTVGRVIEACMSEEILQVKQDLKTALSYTTDARDNHLRVLILAFIASQFLHTSAKDALDMLTMCGNLASGLGAVPGGGKSSSNGSSSDGKKPVDGLGNVPMRMWIGERSLEIHRRTGNARAARKQEKANESLKNAVAAAASR
ncbi:hypothetical protein V5O48_004153 [Marasmius crinis-equi]|uniref:Uncharacterized protein n=1 Tax=Marasmius crinis-equi TaxID=585013 RepID=A0ABR3FQW1_9AGAR